jgi:hypothetical protein
LRKKRGRPMALREKGEEIVKCVSERSERKSVENLRIFFFKNIFGLANTHFALA